ncbi:MAG: tetratricopeptide repeat protein [Phycisphaerales bacterium]|nr:MAG: tetratricopeptide repeat protein [Phycisphaerales bacterium]
MDRRYQEGQEWHRTAIDIAEKTSEEPARKQAVAWSNLAVSYADGGRYGEAVSAARTARDWWRQHDIGAATAAQADLKLGSVLLKQGEALHERGDPNAKAILDEAVKWLGAAHGALQAFGPDYAPDAQLCLEQQDFAHRLLASLGT